MPARVEVWESAESNAEQRYLTHGAFRYFGKLPPTVTGKILDELGVAAGSHVVDVMCGSGTTLLESAIRGAASTGIDANDLSALISKVKTTPVANEKLAAVQKDFEDAFGRMSSLNWAEVDPKGGFDMKDPRSGVPPIRNIEHWFRPQTAQHLLELRGWARGQKSPELRDVALVAFLSSIRAASNASVRTGRLFLDKDKSPQNPYLVMHNRLEKWCDAIATLSRPIARLKGDVAVQVGDARATPLDEGVADVVFCHPPYFSLYRYSSDVLRFELDWGEFNRKKIVSREMEDGFKTTDATLAKAYVADLIDVMREAHRIARPGSHLVIVTADSTLRKQDVGIMPLLISQSKSTPWILTRRVRRTVRFAQASYHRSADKDIKRADDEILFFKRA